MKKVVYTRVGDSDEQGINVVSSRKLNPKPELKEYLQEKFVKIEKSRREKEELEIQRKESSKQKILFITHFNVFLYAACFFIQTGTLPYLTKKLGADPVTFGTLQTVFSVCQLLGGPLYGRIGDVFGEKFAIIVALSSTTLTYLITGLSYSIPVLFLSRFFSVMMHVMQGSQMVATSLSTEENRAGSIARLGFSYGIGMVVGPSLGGIVTSNFGEQYAALLSACGSFLSLCLVIVFVPEFEKDSTKESNKILDINKILNLVLLPKVRGLMLIKTVCGIPIGILQSMFAVIAMDEFGLPPDQNGFLMSYIGILSMIMQGFGVSLITSRLTDLNVVKLSAVTLALSYYALSLLSGLNDFLVLLAPMVCSLSLINSVISSTVTKVVPSKDTGTMLGINMAVNSVIRALAPTIGGMMLTSYGFKSIGILGAFCNALVLILTRFVDI